MNTLSFSRFQLHRQPLRLMEGSRKVPLTQRQLHVLLLLVRARGNAVTREDFLKQVWADSIVEDSNLTQTIFLLRRTLGKVEGGGDLIETVPKIGYRIAPQAFDQQDTGPITPTAESHISQMLPSHNLLVESISDYALYMLDPAGHVRSWNVGAENVKGYSKDEVLGKHYSTFFTHDDVAEGVPERLLARAIRADRVAGEGWRVRKNGERYWASFVLTPVRSSSGRLIGFAKAVHDLTEHKLREDALQKMEAVARQERDCLLAVAESSMDAIFLCAAVRNEHDEIVDFTFTFLNANVEKMILIPRKILLGGSMCELLPANRVLGLFEEYRQVVLTGKPFISTFPIRVQSVTSEWIRLRAVRMGDGVAITASDISEQKRVEERVFHCERRDTLTHLPNRIAALEHISAAQQNRKAGGTVLVLQHVTLQGLRHRNAQLGEANCDELLKQITHRLVKHAKDDAVFRVGGSKFLITRLVKDSSSADVITSVLERCLRHPFRLQGERLQLSFQVNSLSCSGVASADRMLHEVENTSRQQNSCDPPASPAEVCGSALLNSCKPAGTLLGLLVALWLLIEPGLIGLAEVCAYAC